MENFLSEKNVAGRTLLLLTSRGNSIIAELLRLSKVVPQVFGDDEKHLNIRQLKLRAVLFDFTYLSTQEIFDRKLAQDGELAALDDELSENFEVRTNPVFHSEASPISRWLVYRVDFVHWFTSCTLFQRPKTNLAHSMSLRV